MGMKELLIGAYYLLFNRFEYFIIIYLAAINTTYFLLMVMGFFVVRRHHRGLTASEMRSLFRSSLLPSVAVLAPAYNESATIRQSVRAMLALHYPDHEVIVINDGSRDDTLKILIEEFHLYRSSRQPLGRLATRGPILGIYESRDPIRLVVVDKANGGKADALNAGLNVARSDLVAAVDSDSLLEPDALLQVARPFLMDPETVAVGGIIRVANGCTVTDGKVTSIGLPASWIARFQVVEYLRAFLGGRVAFSFMNSLLLISGAFGLFRRWAAIEAGGFEVSTVGEDMELVVRLHHRHRMLKLPCKVVFVPDPVCWTEVPESLKTLSRQRNRWQRGTAETLWLHRGMICNPRYGLVGLFGLPYFAVFEMFGPVVELLGYVFTLTGLLLGLIPGATAALFFTVSIAFGILLSISAILLEEFTLRRYPSPGDVLRLLMAAVLENFGYRQITTLWRARGLIDALRGKKGWGVMERRGFKTT
jgi:cellulose synthase/poly-beta-1,6-N-acetylglucosamine synthase-like glycosyltransferase